MSVPAGESETPPVDHRRRDRLDLLRKVAFLIGVCLAGSMPASAVSLDEAETLFRTGRYDECAKAAANEIETGAWGELWTRLLIESELAQGKYKAALTSLQAAERRFPASASLHLLGREVYRANGRVDEAAAEMKTIENLVASAPRRFATPEGRVVLGRFFLHRGADARKVLDQFYDVVTKQHPDDAEAFYATAELALEKQDLALAAQTLQKAPKDAAEDPRYHYLLARAFSDDDRARSDKALAEALKINPHHVDSLLLKADHLIDGERYGDAEEALKQAFAVNSEEPRAWAYQAVLAHLRNDRGGEAFARQAALSRWATNPEVDHLIGRELSKKYRFAEGSAYQRQALKLDPENLPVKIQLCQDLLRLGEEEEGWKLADEIFAKDGYNVVAYNLTTLRDRLAGFRTLEDAGFVVRMEAREAELYGRRVLALLRRAKERLGKTYGITPKEPVIVEIFPQRKEFAVRTFGLPGADGLLGVCFGRVITANSPASQGETPSNWEAVLWHEFCHVTTLSKTHNKMPRWLSEGISVYEEGRENPGWGEVLNPRYREMILDDAQFTPLSRLSSAFLAPKSPLHLQFAYFESALAVDFFVQRFGHDALNGMLDDLGSGMLINETLPSRTKTSLDQLDREFAEFAHRRAESIAPELTWEEPELPDDASSAALTTWLAAHPKSFWGRKRLGARLVAEEKWGQAKDVLEQLKGLYPEYVGAENAYVLLARVYKQSSDTAAERQVLEELAARAGDAGPAYQRLMELDEAAKDWGALAKDARRLLAVNPLIPGPHRQLARAAEQLGERSEAVTAYRALALLDTTDPAEVHYRLAKLLRADGKPDEARREVLKSLEEAPRFLEAHRLLLELVDPQKNAPSNLQE
jgi:predicted Zn-dependent protease